MLSGNFVPSQRFTHALRDRRAKSCNRVLAEAHSRCGNFGGKFRSSRRFARVLGTESNQPDRVLGTEKPCTSSRETVYLEPSSIHSA